MNSRMASARRLLFPVQKIRSWPRLHRFQSAKLFHDAFAFRTFHFTIILCTWVRWMCQQQWSASYILHSGILRRAFISAPLHALSTDGKLRALCANFVSVVSPENYIIYSRQRSQLSPVHSKMKCKLFGGCCWLEIKCNMMKNQELGVLFYGSKWIMQQAGEHHVVTVHFFSCHGSGRHAKHNLASNPYPRGIHFNWLVFTCQQQQFSLQKKALPCQI